MNIPVVAVAAAFIGFAASAAPLPSAPAPARAVLIQDIPFPQIGPQTPSRGVPQARGGGQSGGAAGPQLGQGGGAAGPQLGQGGGAAGPQLGQGGGLTEQQLRLMLMQKSMRPGGIFGGILQDWYNSPSAPAPAPSQSNGCAHYDSYAAKNACGQGNTWAADRIQQNRASGSERDWYNR